MLNAAKARPGASGAHATVREVRVRAVGREWRIRFDATDPNWRIRALAAVDPLSDAAFAIRKAPLTTAERVAFVVWSEIETLRIWGDDE